MPNKRRDRLSCTVFQFEFNIDHVVICDLIVVYANAFFNNFDL